MSEELVSVVLPFYNQADHLEAVVRESAEALAKIPNSWELILVPNGCGDASVEICHRLAREMSAVRVVESLPGWGEAVMAGLGRARGEILCYTNSARTTPEDLVLALLYAAAYPDVVIKANRKVRESLFRRFGSLLYNLECRMLFDLPQWDINGTPKVFPRRFARLLELERRDDLIDLEFNYVCRRHSYPMVEIPILSTRRRGGASTTGLRTAARLMLGALRMKKIWKDDLP